MRPLRAFTRQGMKFCIHCCCHFHLVDGAFSSFTFWPCLVCVLRGGPTGRLACSVAHLCPPLTMSFSIQTRDGPFKRPARRFARDRQAVFMRRIQFPAYVQAARAQQFGEHERAAGDCQSRHRCERSRHFEDQQPASCCSTCTSRRNERQGKLLASWVLPFICLRLQGCWAVTPLSGWYDGKATNYGGPFDGKSADQPSWGTLDVSTFAPPYSSCVNNSRMSVPMFSHHYPEVQSDDQLLMSGRLKVSHKQTKRRLLAALLR